MLCWIDHRSSPDSTDLRHFLDDYSCFTARPYTVVSGGCGHLPHFYKHKFRTFSNLSRNSLSGSALSWFVFLRSTELPYFLENNSFGTVLYSPHRVMRQFGYDQERPFGHTCRGNYEDVLLNFVSTSSSFTWAFPRPSSDPHRPLPFVIPDDSRSGRYTAGERNYWQVNLKRWEDDTLICSLPVSIPQRLQWGRLLCSPKPNVRSALWPASSRLAERDILMPKSSPPKQIIPSQVPTTSRSLPPRAPFRVSSLAPPQGSSDAEEMRVTRSKTRAATTTDSEIAPPIASAVVPVSRPPIRLIIKPLAKRPLDNVDPSIPAAEDPIKKRRRNLVICRTILNFLSSLVLLLSHIIE